MEQVFICTYRCKQCYVSYMIFNTVFKVRCKLYIASGLCPPTWKSLDARLGPVTIR